MPETVQGLSLRDMRMGETSRLAVEVAAEVREWAMVREYDSDTIFSEEELRRYVGCWGEDKTGEPIDRP